MAAPTAREVRVTAFGMPATLSVETVPAVETERSWPLPVSET